MKKKIAIIGGGISGLAASYYLSKQNFDVTIFEKEDYLGGLLSGVNLDKEIKVEKFYHHIFPTDKECLELFEELNIKNTLSWHKSSNSLFVNNRYYSFSNVFDYLKFPFLNVFQKIHFLFGGLILAKKKLSQVEGLKAKSVIKKYIGKASWKIIWKPLFKKKFGKDYKDVLASWFWWRMNVKLGQKGKEILGYPKNGFSNFLDVLEKEIKLNNGKIILNKKIDKVLKQGSKFLINEELFDKVIFTTSSNSVSAIYKEVEEVKYKAAINVILILGKQQTKWYWNNILEKEFPLVGIIEHTNLVDKESYKGKSIIYLTQYLDSKDPIFSKTGLDIYQEYEKHFKTVGINKNDIENYFVSKSEYAQPVIKNSPKDIGFKVIDKNVFLLSMENIYPEDRGINQAIKYAKQLADKLS